jgi:hypothetical protein
LKNFVAGTGLLVLIAAASPGVSATAPGADTLFARHFEATGGREAAARTKSARVKGTLEQDGQRKAFTLYVKWPGLILLTIEEPSGRLVQMGRDADFRFWQKTKTGFEELTEAQRMDLACLGIAYHPAGWVEMSERLEDAVTEADVVANRPAYAIGRKRVKGIFPRLVFDTESSRLIAIGQSRLSQYRAVGPVQLPHEVRQGLMRVFQVTEIEAGCEIPQSTFQGPSKPGSFLEGLSGGGRRSISLVTNLSAPGKLEVVRQTQPYSPRPARLKTLPAFDARSGANSQVSMQGLDASGLELSDRAADLLHADFDTRTKWPSRLPASFDPAKILELGKDPGLGVRELHRKGIRGKGVGIGTIDFPLLTGHIEYRDRLRLYEEVGSISGMAAHMHGTAVASLAAGSTIGVAPEAELYHIASQNGSMTPEGKFERDATRIVSAVERLLEVNQGLPADRKIRVISLSMGWGPGEKGYEEFLAVTRKAAREKVFVLSTCLRRTHGLKFDGLNRPALADPSDFQSYGPGSWWAEMFWNGSSRFMPGKRLCVPMDARTTASPAGDRDYVHYDYAGWSWSVPWIAGLYALACEVQPNITPEAFWALALKTGRNIRLQQAGEAIDLGTLADPVSLIEALQAQKP